MSQAVRWDINIDRGTDFAAQFYWTSPDNIPFRVVHPMRMDVKDTKGTPVMQFTTNPEAAQLEGASITYNSDLGLIQISASSTATDVAPGVYYYDLFTTYIDTQFDPSAGVSVETPRLVKLVEGTLTVAGRITENV